MYAWIKNISKETKRVNGYTNKGRIKGFKLKPGKHIKILVNDLGEYIRYIDDFIEIKEPIKFYDIYRFRTIIGYIIGLISGLIIARITKPQA